MRSSATLMEPDGLMSMNRLSWAWQRGRVPALLLVFTCACTNSDKTVVGPGESPRVSLSATALQLVGTAGAIQPQVASVEIANAGGGSLGGLAATITYSVGAVAGWLTATLASTVAPTTLQLSAAVVALPAGTYSATIAVSSRLAVNSPQNIAVTLSVSSPGSAIVSIEVSSPVDTLLAVGRMAGLTAVARDALGQVIAEPTFVWRSSNPSVVSVDGGGAASAVAAGVAVVTAEVGAVSGTLRLKVVSADLASITTLAGDAYLQALVQGLRSATRSRIAPVVNGLTIAAQQGNLTALLADVAQLRIELGVVLDPTDRAVLATIVLFAERIQTLIIL